MNQLFARPEGCVPGAVRREPLARSRASPTRYGETLCLLQPINSRQRQQPLKDRCQADQHHEQF